MNRDEALKLLVSDSAHERLRAARRLLIDATPEDATAIDSAIRKENVLWTRTALHDVLRRLQCGPEGGGRSETERPVERIEAASEDIAQDLYENALLEATSQILHEVEPIVGSLSVYASGEIQDYAASNTKKQVDRLNEFFTAIREIRKASSPAIYRQFDMGQMISNCSESTSREIGIRIQPAGRTPFIILGDKARLEVALTNGLRNAAEATKVVQPEEKREPVVVNWGETNDEYWIAILDSGIGIKVNTERVFDFGTTTKPNHFGIGLSTARQALASLDGTVSLTSRGQEGARFELRWPRLRGASQ